MGLLRFSIIAGAALFVSASAFAADMPGDRVALPLPTRALARTDLNSGWYLRGDFAYRIGRTKGAEPAPGFAAPDTQKLENSLAVGLGAGVKYEWLRTDLTVDIGTPMKYEATPGGTSANVTAATFLLNGYLDLGTWYRATPYVGAGAGAARVRIADYTSTAMPPFTGDNAHARWNFAYAGMAGVAFTISPNTIVDLGYRYINFGDATTGADTFGSTTLKRIAAHEVRLGLRWSFDDLPTTR